MLRKQQFQNLLPRTLLSSTTTALAIMLVLALATSAGGQSYNIIFNLGYGTGAQPWAGLTMDKVGNLYGTTAAGRGTVFQLTPRGFGWVFNVLYGFSAPGDGAGPNARVVFGPDDMLYGTTYGGGAWGDGTVFNLSPPTTICEAVTCPWRETVLHSFTGGDGDGPFLGDLIFDQADNIYGTTQFGGDGARGVVYQLTPSGSGWQESVLHAFGFSGDGEQPGVGVIFDGAGNLYGTTAYGGSSGVGTVYRLTYSAGSGWTENVLYNFHGGNDGYVPAGLTFGASGNLYGTTTDGGQGGGGTVFELTPSGSGWNYVLVYSFAGVAGHECGPFGPLVMDKVGNLYGATYCDGANNAGNVFKLTLSDGAWTYTSLHDFSTTGHDGSYPIGNVISDSRGNLYGTTSQGGIYSGGIVWEITPN